MFSYEGASLSTASWNFENTVWGDEVVEQNISMLSEIGEDGDGTSSAALAAGVLSLTLLGYCVFVRPGAQKTTDEF